MIGGARASRPVGRRAAPGSGSSERCRGRETWARLAARGHVERLSRSVSKRYVSVLTARGGSCAKYAARQLVDPETLACTAHAHFHTPDHLSGSLPPYKLVSVCGGSGASRERARGHDDAESSCWLPAQRELGAMIEQASCRLRCDRRPSSTTERRSRRPRQGASGEPSSFRSLAEPECDGRRHDRRSGW